MGPSFYAQRERERERERERVMWHVIGQKSLLQTIREHLLNGKPGSVTE